MKKELKVKWDKSEEDLLFVYNNTQPADANYLHYALTKRNSTERNILEELEYRGYDIKTLKISVEKKQ